MNVSDYIANYLSIRKVTHTYELVGGMITYLLDSINRNGSIKVISMHHEQGAAFASEGWARIKRDIPGVALATSGPGSTNLLTSIGSCYFDSIPTIFLTGQVNRSEQKRELGVRQLGFQETDIISMAQPITKLALSLSEPEDVFNVMELAFMTALTGRPGPVLIDIPMDVQKASISNEVELTLKTLKSIRVGSLPSRDSVAISSFFTDLNKSLAKSKYPLILVGGGINSSCMEKQFCEWVEELKIPVIYSLMALDCLPDQHPLKVGMIGTYGNRWANWAIDKCDLMIVLGSRLDIRQTGADVNAFIKDKILFQVDCDSSEIDNRIKVDYSLIIDLPSFFDFAFIKSNKLSVQDTKKWINMIQNIKIQLPDTDESDGVGGIDPNQIIKEICERSSLAGAFTVDVGQHQMWAAQSLRPREGQRILNSGGMGSMGFALPAAIGASFALRENPVVVLVGDGGIQLNIQELQTIVTHHLPIKIIVFNNHAYGMVRQFQEAYFEERYQSTVWGYEAPDFVSVAKAYGISGMSIHSTGEISEALEMMWENPQEPFLLNVFIDQKRNAYPKMMFGSSLSEMIPTKKINF
ncbi:MAG: thiamine pyrophosphate-binding protein [Akkermansia sp.]